MLARILDIGSDAADEPDLRVRKRTAVATALIFIAVAVILGIVDLAVGEPTFAGLALVQIFAFAVALLLFRRSHHLAPLVATMTVVGLLLLFLSLIPSGGLSFGAADLVWIVLVPLGAVLFLGPRAALPALGTVVLVVLAAVLIDPFIRATPREPSAARLLFIAIDLLVPTALALGLVVFIDGERVRAKAQAETLLLNILPRSIADRLNAGERVIADHCDGVTILFADLVNFTPLAAREAPDRVVNLLNQIFSSFDTLAERYGLEKIKTIGDAYMAAAGVPVPRPDHATVAVDMAVAMHAAIRSIRPAGDGKAPRLRIGIASGTAVAGVIGHRKFSYDLWGDAVNLASRMESTGVPGTIQVAESTWRLCANRYPFTTHEVEAKGLGTLTTYLLDPAAIQERRGLGA
ncbi:MAG TPA: adenylate/guanylate cyclase domain-containing protein [Candidatus Limnocylindrales bacterium]